MYNGALMLLQLKINKGWQVIGGLRTTKLEISNQLIDSSNVSSGAWRELSGSNGLKHMNISASGMFTDSESEKTICKLAFTGELAEYKLSFANKDSLQGKFQVMHYDRFGEVDEEESYSITIASSGKISAISSD